MMSVSVNNNTQQIGETTSIQELLVQNDIIQTRGIAIAINNIVIPKSIWPQKKLKPNDVVVIITATAGG